MGDVVSLGLARKGGAFEQSVSSAGEKRDARMAELVMVAPQLEIELERIFGSRLKMREESFKELESPACKTQYRYYAQFENDLIQRYSAASDLLFPLSGYGATRAEAVAALYFAVTDGLAPQDAIRRYANRAEDIYETFVFGKSARRFSRAMGGWDYQKPAEGAPQQTP